MLRPMLCAAFCALLAVPLSHAQNFQGLENLTSGEQKDRPAAPADQEKPQDQPKPQPDQPAQEPQRPADPFSGTYQGEKLSVQLALQDPQNGLYGGQITMGQQAFPLRARVGPQGLVGQFKSGEDIFDFTATLNGDTLSLVSGNATYQLKKVGAAPQGQRNPLEQGPGPVNPLGQAAPGKPQLDQNQPQPPQTAKPTQVLRLQLPPGTYRLTESGQNSLNNRNPTANYNQDIRSDTLYRLRIGQPDAKGQIPIGITLQRIRFIFTVNGMQMEFDSEHPRATDTPAFASLRSLVGHEIPLLIRPNGESEMDNRAYADILKGIRDQDQMAAMNLQMLFPDMEKTLQNLPPMNYLRLAPPANAQPGQQWKASIVNVVPDPFKSAEVTGNAVLQSVENGASRVRFTANWKAPASDQMEAGADFVVDAVFPGDSTLPSGVQLQSENTLVAAAINSQQRGRINSTIQISRE